MHRPHRNRTEERAFTLIELLIVVAIIAILAAIAVPNFLEAQTRSKVSRVKADMRSIATAVEAYSIDNNSYPLSQELLSTYPNSPFNTAFFGFGFMAYAGRLSTPISYITQVPRDIFNEGNAPNRPDGFSFFEYWSEEDNLIFGINDINGYRREFLPDSTRYLLWSWGPDRVAFDPTLPVGLLQDQVTIYNYYDPTNGTVSYGNILRPGPGGGLKQGST